MKESLEKENAFLKNILDSSLSISIVATDIDGHILFWNKGAENMFGYTAGEVMGKKVSILYPDDKTTEEVKRLNAYIVREKKETTCNIKEITKDNRQLWVHLSLTPRLDNSGRVIGILGVGKDITKQVNTEKALLNSQWQLYQSQKMEALNTLVAGATHEINNPLNLITLNLSLLTRIWEDLMLALKELSDLNPSRKYGGLTYSFLKKHLRQILSDMDVAAKRIAGVVSDLKNFSRQSNIIDKTEININTVVKNALRLIQTTLNRAGIDVRLNLAEDIPSIEGNQQAIEQTVFNIVLNAIQAINHDHGKIIITTGFKRATGNIDIVISDNGPGISPAIMNKIFDPFVTDKQDEGRTGLGLSVAYSLVKAHNGNITFTTNTHEGTTFTISIPIVNRQRNIKVLIADDDKLIREILAEVLTVERGYEVSQAANGTEVNIKLGTYHPDILILDLFMPKMDGLEVCRAIKNEPELADMKVMITTGFPSDPKLEEIYRMGFTKICSKPFNIPYFLEQIDAMLISS